MDRLGFNEPSLITKSEESTFDHELVMSMQSCNKFYFSVAFINVSGLQLLLDALNEVDSNNVKGKIIVSTYLHFTNVRALKRH